MWRYTTWDVVNEGGTVRARILKANPVSKRIELKLISDATPVRKRRREPRW